MTRKPHHSLGNYQRRAAALVANANNNPGATCWRCGRTIAQIRATKPRAHWTAGHLTPGLIGGQLVAECSPCNYGHGARLGNARRRARKNPRQW